MPGWLWSPQLWFSRPKNLCSLNDLSGLNSLNGLNDLDSLISSKTLLILMVWSSLAPKWPLPIPFCGIDRQKSNFSLISDTLSVGGCWGQPMSFFWKLVDETQISAPPEATRHHKSKKNIGPSIPQSQFKKSVSKWDTLYVAVHLFPSCLVWGRNWIYNACCSTQNYS